MPPLNSQSPVGAPNPQYDFIMNSGPPPAQKSKLPLPKLPKVAVIIIGVVVVLIILAVVFSIISSSGKSSATPYVDAISRSQEIVRVSTLAKTDIRDADTLALLSTTNAALASDQAQIGAYVAKAGLVVDPKLLTKYQNPETDKGLATAVQNNNVEQAYLAYLKGSLSGYLTALQAAYGASGNDGKAALAGPITSTQTLLSAPQLSQ